METAELVFGFRWGAGYEDGALIPDRYFGKHTFTHRFLGAWREGEIPLQGHHWRILARVHPDKVLN